MEKNKAGKYFKYAIGEIVLVVIGILIALSINNWNEQRKNRASEKALYDRILTDLQIDENRIVSDIKYYRNNQSIHHKIYKDTQGIFINDSLIDFSKLRAALGFNLTIEANYSKFIKDISKDKIREKIDSYFKLEHFVMDANQYLWNLKEVKLRPFLSKYGINNTRELFNNHQLDYYDLREKDIFSYSKLKEQYGTVEFDQLLFDLGIKTSWAITALNDVLTANKELQLELKNELNEK
jgi:hypothetical protein